MTYEARETSVNDGNPVFLYRFVRGGTQYDFCSQPEDLVLAGTPSGTFSASAVKHGRLGVGQPARKDTLDVVFPLSDSFASLFLKRHTQFLPTTLTIWRGHHDDPDGEFRVIFKGKVRAGKPVDRAHIGLACTGLYSSVKMPGLGGFAHRSCRHALYFGRCGLNRADFEEAGTVTAISGSVCTISEASGQADDFFTGGTLEYSGAQVFITGHTGSAVTLRAVPQILADRLVFNGYAEVTIAPGCNRSVLTCRDKFDNVPNFGGFPYIPENDPWNDGSIA